MGDPKGFIKYERKEAGYRPVDDRLRDYSEVEQTLNAEDRKKQAARCMDCGVPFCNWHCPLGNQIPDFQDRVYKGQWKEAYEILSATNNFPEFTGRICPALCEHSCVLAQFETPVTIRENEVAVVERAFMEGYVKPQPPQIRTGKKVAVVGSGPSGLVVADQLNKAGHTVTLFEKDDAVGGLLRYGIPDFKMNKYIIDRRVNILEQEGLIIKTNTHVGKDIEAEELLKSFDAVCIAAGALEPRDLNVQGRDLDGIHFALDFLIQQNKLLKGVDIPDNNRISAKGKNVLVIGGGDTGADCVGTANRQHARSVTQIEIMPEPPIKRTIDNPWPYYAKVLKTSTSHKEGCERYWNMATKKFSGKDKKVIGADAIEVEWEKDKTGNFVMKEIPGKEKHFDAELVLLALGFVHTVHHGLADQLGLKYDHRGNIKVNQLGQTSIPNVFSAGDAARGATLVVKAMQDARDTAEKMDVFLNGE
jgi:glutamate synthase (NADPH) small chain